MVARRSKGESPGPTTGVSGSVADEWFKWRLVPRVLGLLFEGGDALLLLLLFMAFHTAAASAILMRLRPSSTLPANLIASGSAERFSVVHSQKDAINAALSTESFESIKPASMMGIRPAAARRRLSSGVAGGICFDISRF